MTSCLSTNTPPALHWNHLSCASSFRDIILENKRQPKVYGALNVLTDGETGQSFLPKVIKTLWKPSKKCRHSELFEPHVGWWVECGEWNLNNRLKINSIVSIKEWYCIRTVLPPVDIEFPLIEVPKEQEWWNATVLGNAQGLLTKMHTNCTERFQNSLEDPHLLGQTDLTFIWFTVHEIVGPDKK